MSFIVQLNMIQLQWHNSRLARYISLGGTGVVTDPYSQHEPEQCYMWNIIITITILTNGWQVIPKTSSKMKSTPIRTTHIRNHGPRSQWVQASLFQQAYGALKLRLAPHFVKIGCQMHQLDWAQTHCKRSACAGLASELVYIIASLLPTTLQTVGCQASSECSPNLLARLGKTCAREGKGRITKEKERGKMEVGKDKEEMEGIVSRRSVRSALHEFGYPRHCWMATCLLKVTMDNKLRNYTIL